jgi:hypothetical protein
MKLLVTICVDFDVTDQLLITFSAFIRYSRKKWDCNDIVHQLFIDIKKAYDQKRRKVLYNILIQFGIPTKFVWLIKMCLNETCSKIHTGKHLSDSFTIQNGLKHGDYLSPLHFKFALEYAITVHWKLINFVFQIFPLVILKILTFYILQIIPIDFTLVL